MKHKLQWVLALCSLVVLSAHAQQRRVTGTVTSSEDNGPIPGVNVVLKSAKVGTITDVDGNYAIDVTGDEDVLQYSYIGMESQEVEVGNRSRIDVQMAPDVTELSEIVVTAVGIERNMKNLGYAVQELEAEQLTHKAEPDVLRALSGKIAGVQIFGSNGAPGSSTKMVIRGYGTTRNNQPLFVVDGVPYDNSLEQSDNTLVQGAAYSNRLTDLNTNDVASITVLKGGAAAALYGSRAANGAVIITTKSGSKNFAAQKMFNVSYDFGYSVQEVARLPKFQNKYGQGADGIFNSGFFGTWGPAFDAVDSVTDYQGNRVAYQAYPDNVSDFYERGSLMENTVSVTARDERYSFNASFNNTNQQGIIPWTSYHRTSMSMGGNVQLSNKFSAGGSFTYTQARQLGPQTGGGGVSDGSVHRVLWFVPRSFDLSGYPYQDPVTFENQYYRSGVLNPYWVAKENPFKSDLNRINGFLRMGYEITDWAELSYQIGINQYGNPRTTVYARGNPIEPRGRIISDNISYRELESNLLLRMGKTLTSGLDIQGILGWNVNEREGDHQQVIGNGIVVWGIDQIRNTQDLLKGEYPLGGQYFKRRLWGLFADLQLSYNDYVILGITGRNDWSSTLPAANQSFFYPSVSLSFLPTELWDFDSDVLSFAKLRANWAEVGNDAGPYDTQTTYVANDNIGTGALDGLNWPFGGRSSITVGNTLGNETLRPEFTTEYELGADLGFFDDRINVSYSYYNRTTRDLITSITLPATSGFLAQVINAGEIENRGHELSIDADVLRTPGGFTWNILANYTRNRNTVLSLANDQEQIDLPGSRFFSRGQVLRKGEPYGLIEGQAMLRDDEGNLLINQADGLPIADPNVSIIGDPNPDFMWNMTNTVSWKGLSLSALIDARIGGDMFIGTVQDMRARGVLEETAIDRNRMYLVPGVLANNNLQPLIVDGKKVPNNLQVNANDYFFNGPVGYANGADEPGIFDGTYFKLRELQLRYQIPASLLQRTGLIERMSVAFTARNIWFVAPNLPDDSGIDPETDGLSAGNQSAMINNYVPNTRSYGINIGITF
jgi:TonB-linked SusC/RagA family outer membrane protein